MFPSGDRRENLPPLRRDGDPTPVPKTVDGALPSGFREAIDLDPSTIRKLPLAEQVAILDPLGAMTGNALDPGKQMEAARRLVMPVKDGLSSNLFDHVLGNIRFSSEEQSERIAALEKIFSAFSYFSAISPKETIGTDQHGEPVTLGERLVRALPEASRITGSSGELLRIIETPVPDTAEWREAKDLAIVRTIFEGSYGKGFLYLRPDGGTFEALASELSAVNGGASPSSVLAEALRAIDRAAPFEQAVLALTEGLANISRQSAERYEAVIAVADRLQEPLQTIASTAGYLSSRPPEYRRGEPLAGVDAELLSKAVATLSEIAAEREVSLGKARLEEAFTAEQFGSFADLLTYADPKRVAGFRDGGMHWREQQKVAIRLFDWLGSVAEDAISQHEPSAKELRQLLETPVLFPRGQLHEPPSGPHIYPVIEKLARIGFARASCIEEWVEIASFSPQSAAEFEGQKRSIVHEHLPKLFGMTDRASEISAALRVAGERWLERPIETLSKIPPSAGAREALPALIEELGSADSQFAPALRAHCAKLFERYDLGIEGAEPGYSKNERNALRRAYRGTTTMGRVINLLWPF